MRGPWKLGKTFSCWSASSAVKCSNQISNQAPPRPAVASQPRWHTIYRAHPQPELFPKPVKPSLTGSSGWLTSQGGKEKGDGPKGCVCVCAEGMVPAPLFLLRGGPASAGVTCGESQLCSADPAAPRGHRESLHWGAGGPRSCSLAGAPQVPDSTGLSQQLHLASRQGVGPRGGPGVGRGPNGRKPFDSR